MSSAQPARPLKKARCAVKQGANLPTLAESPNDMFFFLYDDDLAEVMFKFASIKCLCKLDILCKRTKRTTPSRWAEKTMSRLGLAGGKRDWRHYHVLVVLGPTFFRLEDEGDFGFGDMLAGSPDVTSNGNIVVAVSDEVDAWDRRYPGESQAIALRDAFSLNFVKLLSSPINNWKVAICGRAGSEIIVTSNNRQISAQRGQDVQLRDFTGQMSANAHGIPMLGCETHLLALAGNRLLLFAVGSSDNLLILRQNTLVTDNYVYDPAEDSPSAFAWHDDQSHFAFAFPRSSQIQIWRLDVEHSKAFYIKSIGVDDRLSIVHVALSDDFVVASCQMKKIHIWDRRTGTKMHTLCDVEEHEQLEPDEIIYPLCMHVYGGFFLVSASHLGNALCIWNMRTGELMRKYNDAEDQREVDMLPDGIDVTSMTYVAPLNAFICMSGHMMVWAFPMTTRQISMVKSIKRRERWISRAILQDDDDNGE